MAKLHRSASSLPRQLLNRVLETPALVAAVRELPPTALGRLIDAVGLEDASELVALATTKQLESLFDDDLWQSEKSGADPEFSPERFALWLEVLFEAGEGAVVERLTELPFDFVALAFSRLLLVLDMGQLEILMCDDDDDTRELTEKALDGTVSEEWEEYRLIAREPAHFDVVWTALMTLDREHDDLLRRLVERIALTSSEYISGNGGLFDVLSSDELLEADARAARDDRRAGRGYVAPSDARSFLSLARQGLGEPDERDPVTRAFFRELEAHAKAGRTPRAGTRSEQGLPLHTTAQPSAEAAKLLRLIERANRMAPKSDPVSSALVVAPSPDNLLQAALRLLGERDAEVVDERREELAYLANVVMSGEVTCDGHPHRPVSALERAVWVCELGLRRVLAERSRGKDPFQGDPRLLAESAVPIVRDTPLDLLFRRGLREEVMKP